MVLKQDSRRTLGSEMQLWHLNSLGCTLYRIITTSLQKAFPPTLNSVSFRRNLVGERLAEWHKLVEQCREVTLNNEEDMMVWLLISSKLFSVKSFYLAMQDYGSVLYNLMWKVKIPLRVKKKLWLVSKIKYSDEKCFFFLKRGGKCTKSCLFCG
jgi:hypothetical protein